MIAGRSLLAVRSKSPHVRSPGWRRRRGESGHGALVSTAITPFWNGWSARRSGSAA
jgi:hypothetical protein